MSLKIFDNIFPDNFSKERIDIFSQLNEKLKKDIAGKIDLPKKYITLSDGRIIKAGHIVFRPLVKKKNISYNGFNHYAIILGTNEKDEKFVVDINDDRNVSVIPFEKFKLNFSNELIQEEKNDVELKLILKRIIEMQSALYYFDEFNCRHFVNYCVYGKKESEAVKTLVAIISPLISIYLAYLQFRQSFLKNDRDKKLYADYINIFIKINENIQKLK